MVPKGAQQFHNRLQAPTTSIPSDVDVQRPLESSAVILEGKEYYRDALGTIWNFTAAGEWEWVDENRIPVGAVIFNMAELEEGSFARDRALAAHEVVGASTPGLMVPPKISSSVEGQGILSGAIPSAARVDVPHRNASSSIGPEVFEGPGILGVRVGVVLGVRLRTMLQPLVNHPDVLLLQLRCLGITHPVKQRLGPSSSIPQVASGMGHTVERPEVLGKRVMSLPTLSEYSASNPTALGDWLAIVKPTLSSLTDSGHVWWDYTFDRASRAYTKWLSVSPLERLGIQAELEMYGTHMPQHILLEQRASILLLQAIPEVVKTDIVATRRMSPSQHNVALSGVTYLGYFSAGGDQGSQTVGAMEAIVGQNLGLLDTCASHAIRTLRAGEPVPTDSVEVALATGCAHMLINSVGTLVTRETVCPVVPFHLAHSHLHVDFDVIDGRCTVVHPQKGDLKAQVLDGRIVIDRQVALDMIADLETALGDAAARGGSGSSIGSSIDDLLQGTAASKAIAGSEEDVVSGFLNVARVDGVHGRTQGVGLLDSGASHPLRSLRPGEPLPTKRVTVALALGKKEMMLTDGGTLVTSERVDPLVPIGKASELVGLQVRWRKGKCTATHPKLGPLEVETVNGCPCIAEAVALRIIDEMEQKGVAHMLQSVRALQGCPSADTEHSVRECLHGAMRSGNQDDFIQACWRWLRWYYPDVPESMLVDLLPASGVGELLYNRHKRRRLKKTRRVIVHLHSGGPRLHLPSSCGEVLEVDFRTDLHSSSVWTYILSLAIEGKVVAVVGGPPCETVAQFRGVEDGGPPVLRGRCDEGRFWKDGLSYSSEELAKKDGLLFLKVLFLFETAVQARQALSLEQSSSVHAGVFFALESPQDPELVGQKFSQIGCSVMCREDVAEEGQPSLASPTFFAWPEVRSFRTRYNLLAAHCDQGALGHYMVKPTTVLTSDFQLWESLEQVHVRVPWVVSVPEEASQRLAMSRSWSLWAPGLTARIKRCLRAWLAHSSFVEHQAVSEERAVHLAKLTAEESEYRDHCLRGHIPFRKDCEVCVRAAGKDRRHLRQKYGSAYTLSLDLGGPWQEAKDLYQTQRHVLIGTYQFPLLDKPATEEGFPIPDDVVGAHEEGDGADDVSLEPEDGDIVTPDERLEASEVEVKKVIESEEAWRALKDHATKPVRMINFMIAEPLKSKKHRSEVLAATQRILVKLQHQGYPVLRLHTDRGGEFVNQSFRTFCEARQIFRTTGDPGSPQSNGRSEATVGVFKKGVRALLKQANLDSSYWARAAVHWSALRRRGAEQQLGLKPRDILPFGARVHVRRRAWELRDPSGSKKGRQWLDRTQPALLLGPCTEVSGGYIVEARGAKDDPDKLVMFPTTVVYDKVEHKSSVPECDAEFTEELPAPPKHRMRFKGVARTMRVPGETDAEVLPALRRFIPDGSLRSLCCTNRGEGPVACEVLQEDLEVEIPSGDSPRACIAKPCYTDDIAKSEELAREWLEQKKFSPQECLELLESVGLDFRANRRGDIHCNEDRIQAVTLGQYVRGHMCGVTNAAKHRPMFVKYLVSFVREHNPDVVFSAVYLSCNTAVGVHIEIVTTITRATMSSVLLASLRVENCGCKMMVSLGRINLQWHMVLNRGAAPDGLSQHSRLEEVINFVMWIGVFSWTSAFQCALIADQEQYLIAEVSLPEVFEGSATSEWLQHSREIERQLEQSLQHAGSLLKMQQETIAQEAGDNEEFLQTRTIPTTTAMQELEDWREALSDEVNNLITELQVVERTTEQQLAEMACQVRQAAEEEWFLAGLDISKAFLTAPMSQVQRQGRLIIVQPPKAAVKLGLASPSERWVVRKALYGLAESPAAWVEWRDTRLLQMRWQTDGLDMRFKKSEVDPSLYLLIATDSDGKESVKGTLGLYVDDFLLAGSMSIITDAIQQIRAEWKTSEPEFCGRGHDDKPLKFLGIQIFWNDGAYYLNQEDFVRDLLQRRGFKADAGGIGGAGPMSKEAPPDEPEEVSVEALRKAQAAVGELLWLALKSRADLAFCTSQLSVWCTRYPSFVARKADEVFHYLSRTVTLGLKYSKVDPMSLGGDSQLRFKRSVTVLEAYTDASFAAGCEGEETARSHSGAVVVWADSPVMWMTQRQTTIVLSTAEAELNAAQEGTTMLQSVAPIVSMLLGINEDGLSKALYIDSVSACSIISVVAGAWRTRHLRIRAAGLRSLLNSGYLVVAHLKGEHMLADMLTKLMNGAIFVNLKQMWQMTTAPSTHLVSDAARAAAAAVAILVATMLQGYELVQATSSTSSMTTSSTTRWFDRADIGFLLVLVFVMVAVHKVVSAVFRSGMIRSWW
ncbi:RE2 [Symbiodinium sp. CCMP2592]|nr:RE2 [Symbiodinium sp. CCMP2592]